MKNINDQSEWFYQFVSFINNLRQHYHSTNHTITTPSLSTPRTLPRTLTIHSLLNSLSRPLTHTIIFSSLFHSLNHSSYSLSKIFSHSHSFLLSLTPCTSSLTKLHTYVNMRVWKGGAALFGLPVCLHFDWNVVYLVLLACFVKFFSFHNASLQHNIKAIMPSRTNVYYHQYYALYASLFF